MKEDSGFEIMDMTADSAEKFKIPVYLFYSADMTIKEIAEILNIPVGTVKSRMNKAKSLIKEWYTYGYLMEKID